MENDLSNCKVGDWIWTIREGWEKITHIGRVISTENNNTYFSAEKKSKLDKAIAELEALIKKHEAK